MARPRRQHQADDAAKAASEAAKVLQKRSQETRETVEKVPGERPDDWTPPKRDDTHSRSVEEIVASRPVEAQEPPEPKVETKAEPEPAKVEPETPATETPTEPVVEAPKTVKGKVDGEEYDVPEEEVEAAGGIRAWQRDKAAENRLKKSNEILAEQRRTQAAMAEMLQQMQQAQKPKEPDVTDQQFIASKMDTIRFGTPVEAADAQLEILQRLHKPVNENEILQKTVGFMDRHIAAKQFDAEYQDIVTNPDLLQLVIFKLNKKISEAKGPIADWPTTFRSIGNEVRSIVGKPTSTTTTQSTTSGTPSQQSEKEAKKAATVVSIPTSSARVSPPQEEKPETREDLIREMRKKRGLPVD